MQSVFWMALHVYIENKDLAVALSHDTALPLFGEKGTVSEADGNRGETLRKSGASEERKSIGGT